MTVALIGPPASGKSRVGRRLAARLGKPHVDTDATIVAAHGPIAGIFSRHGEAYFRTLERDAVRDALGQDAVVSLGGGAVLDLETRARLTRATVILLTTTADAVATRIGNRKRPLVSSIDDWQRLFDERRTLYESLASYTVDASTRGPKAIADELAAWLEGRQ